MVVGREAELRRVAGLLAAARLGRGSTVLLVGEAGMGKSTLLDETARLAVGATVVRVVGTPAEREVPYAALGLVLGDASPELARLPRPQAHALGAALALVDGDGPPPFAVGAATLAVLAHRAESGPLVLLLDDAHLLDAASSAALAFAARRLTADPVLVLAAVRPDEPGPWTGSGFPALHLAGLGEGEVSALLVALGYPSGPEVAARARAVTGGNPLAVGELVRRADAGAVLASGGPVPLPQDLVAVFSARAREHGSEVRLLVGLVALAGPAAAVVAGASALLGLAPDVLERAERAGLVAVGGGSVTPTHPLVGSAVFADLEPAERRRLHAAVAASLPPGRTDERAHHLAAAAAGPDEPLAVALEEVASVAAGRGAPSAAAAALERSAAITSAPDRAAGRLARAAAHAWAAGDAPWAIALCDSAARVHPDERWRADALTGAVEARTGSLDRAGAALLAAAVAAPPTDVESASRVVCDLVDVAFYRADPALALDAAGRAEALLAAGATGPARGRCLMVRGMAEVLAGRSGETDLGAALAELGVEALSAPDGGDEGRRSDDDAARALVTLMWLRGAGAAEDLARAIEARRGAWALGSLPRLLFHLGRDAATRDRWAEARSAYAEAIELAHELGQVTDEATALAGLAWVEARSGDTAGCAAHAAAASELAVPRANRVAEVWSDFARADAALSAGEVEEALARYAALSRRLDAVGLVDVDLHPGPEHAECLVLLGRTEEAEEVVALHDRRARAKGRPWALARAARARGLLVGADELDDVFARARALHDRTTDTYEGARTALLHGQRLRRLRRRSDARVPLRSALEAFERLGARPWADRAAAELEATGETTVRRGATVLDVVTPRERQIVELVTGGLTTRETALRLFLSPKTVEYHLRNVYARLGITSRAELTRLVGEDRDVRGAGTP